jgi:predicted DNA-binding protein
MQQTGSGKLVDVSSAENNLSMNMTKRNSYIVQKSVQSLLKNNHRKLKNNVQTTRVKEGQENERSSADHDKHLEK